MPAILSVGVLLLGLVLVGGCTNAGETPSIAATKHFEQGGIAFDCPDSSVIVNAQQGATSSEIPISMITFDTGATVWIYRVALPTGTTLEAARDEWIQAALSPLEVTVTSERSRIVDGVPALDSICRAGFSQASNTVVEIRIVSFEKGGLGYHIRLAEPTRQGQTTELAEQDLAALDVVLNSFRAR
jgi:hypothetical protein